MCVRLFKILSLVIQTQGVWGIRGLLSERLHYDTMLTLIFLFFFLNVLDILLLAHLVNLFQNTLHLPSYEYVEYFGLILN